MFSAGFYEDMQREHEENMANPVWVAEQEAKYQEFLKWMLEMQEKSKGIKFKPIPILEKMRLGLIAELNRDGKDFELKQHSRAHKS